MTLVEKLYDLKGKRGKAIDRAKALALEDKIETEDYKKETEAIKTLGAQIEQLEALIAQDQPAEPDSPARAKKGLKGAALAPEPEDGHTKAVKAFAAAARDGFRAEKATGDLMSEGVDPDGGYTVPEDIVNDVIRIREAKESLLDEVTVIPVTAKSGRRTIKTRAQHAGFATVEEAAKMPKLATPQFATLSYDVKKRRGYLPVANELLEDSDANIVGIATEWLGDESRATGNRIILEAVATKPAEDLSDLDGILKAWVGLGSAFRGTSKLYTNDDGLLYLGTLKDGNGRYLLTPNPADPHELRLCVGPYTLPVKTYDNSTLATTEGKIPMILGDLKEGVVYWDRRTFSVRVYDNGVVGNLNALEQDLTLWAGSQRDDCSVRDETAFVNGYIAAGAAGAAVMSTKAAKA